MRTRRYDDGEVTLARKIVRAALGFAVGFFGAVAVALLTIHLTTAAVGERMQPRGAGWLLLPIVGGLMGALLFLPENRTRRRRRLAAGPADRELRLDESESRRGWVAPGFEAGSSWRRGEAPPLSTETPPSGPDSGSNVAALEERRRASGE